MSTEYETSDCSRISEILVQLASFADVSGIHAVLCHQPGLLANAAHDPRVQVKQRDRLRVHWHMAIAHLRSDDVPRERQRWLTGQVRGVAKNAAAVRLFGTELLTVDLDGWTFRATLVVHQLPLERIIYEELTQSPNGTELLACYP